MEARCSIFWSTTPLYIMSFCIFFEDDKRMFKLTSCLYIHTKVCLEWIGNLHSFWNIEKCTTTPYCSMKCCEHMICRRNCLHKVFSEKFFMTMDRHRHILENNPLILKFLSEAMVDNLTIILSTDSSEYFSLSFWNTKSIKGFFYSTWNIIPRLRIPSSLSLCKIINTLEIERIK